MRDAASAQRWIGDVLESRVARLEAPVLAAAASTRGEPATSLQSRRWNERFIASRETAELRAETLQMGYSLAEPVSRTSALGDAPRSRTLPFPAAVRVRRRPHWDIEPARRARRPISGRGSRTRCWRR